MASTKELDTKQCLSPSIQHTKPKHQESTNIVYCRDCCILQRERERKEGGREKESEMEGGRDRGEGEREMGEEGRERGREGGRWSYNYTLCKKGTIEE